MQLPGPFRAAVGLLATVADEARNLPDRALELPMLAVSTALQASLRAQQRYARLTARGDEALSGRRSGDEPPQWATFDDPLPSAQLRTVPNGHRGGADAAETDRDDQGPDAAASRELLDRLFGADDGDDNGDGPARQAVAARKTAAAKKAAAKKAAAKRAPAPRRPATARKAAPGGKSVNSPRHTAPSRFDNVDPESLDDETGADTGSDNTAQDGSGDTTAGD